MDGTPHKFRLERIRSLRERSEDQAKQALAESLARKHAAEASVRQAATQIAVARDALAGAATAATDAASMLARQAYLEHSEAIHRESLQHLHGRSGDVDASRNRLIEASRARQSMDRLHDRSLLAHQLEAGRRETANLDEIALNTFRRKAVA